MLEILSEIEFNEFTQKNSIFFQSSYWGTLKQSNGWIPHLVGIKENGEVIAASLLLAKKIPIFNKYFFYAPRGFVLDYKNKYLLKQYTNEIKKYIQKNNGIFIKINPLVSYQERDVDGKIVENGFDNKELVKYLKELGFKQNTNGNDLEPHFISVLDLENKTEDQLLKEMRSTTRWSIKNSYKNSLKIIDAKKEDLVKFKELMKHTSERRGFIDRPLHYYENMYDCFSKSNNIKVLLVEFDAEGQATKYKEDIESIKKKLIHAKENKKEAQIKEFESQISSIEKKLEEVNQLKTEYGNKIIIASGLYMLFGNQIVYLFGASLKPFMKYNSQYLLEWEMIKYALKNNYDKFNFYGIDPAFDPKDPMYGLFDFKRGFNSKVVELIGEFTLVTNKFYYILYNMTFKLYRKIKKVLK